MTNTLVRGNRDLIKAMNRSLILNCIRREGQLSRTQLVSASGLSTGAVSQITTDLLNNEWLLETGESDYTGGRRQTILRLNPQAGYAVGLKLMEDRAVCAIADFEANIIYHEDRQLGDISEHPTAIKAIVQLVDDAIQSSGIPRAKVLGVGIALAGIIDSQSGVVNYSPYFGWRGFSLAALVQKQLHLPTFVENDVNTLTLSEYLFGAGRHHTDFVVFTVGRGIGMGMMLEGRLYQGLRGGAGEIGHIIVNLEQATTQGEEAGTLEANASDPSVIRAVFPQESDQHSLQEVITMAEAGEEPAIAALAYSGHYLGVGLATIINMLHPPLIIVSGEGIVAGDFRLKPMLASMRQYTFGNLLDGIEVVIEATDDRAWVRGAASIVIGKVFQSPLVAAKASSQ